MKKVAILISGLPRNFNNYLNIKQYLIDCNPCYEFDIFIGLWSKNIINISKTIDTGMENVMQDIDIEDVIKQYNPLSHIVLDVIKEHTMFKNNIINKLVNYYTLVNIPTLYHPMLSQIYCMYKTFENFNEYIIKNNINYDLVIRYRFDLFTSDPILLDNFDSSKIYAIKRVPYFPDWLFISTFENMKYIFCAYEYYINCLLHKDTNYPELVFKNSCYINKIPISYTMNDTFSINKNGFELKSLGYKKYNGLE